MSSPSRRVACLRIPDFPIAVHLGREACADLLGAAVVVRSEGARAEVAAASEAARRYGIVAGVRAADARALCPGLREWEWTPALYDEMATGLAAALLAVSPRVNRAGLGAFWLDAGGWDRRGGDAAFIEAARSAALAAGYPEARIGVADTAAAAQAATQLDGGAVYRVPPGDDARFLATLPLRVLSLSDELLELFGALGLATAGELAALAVEEVEARLGAEGVRAHRWARGLDDGKEGPFGDRPPADWSVEVEFPGPVERSEPLLFLLKSCLDHLSGALAVEGLCLRHLGLTIETEEGPVRQTVSPARPTRRVGTLLSLCRGALADLRLPGRALAIRVAAEGVVPALAEQADLFEPPRPDPDALANALARLQGRWGPESVVRPAAADSHRPERAGRWEPVDVISELVRAQRGTVGHGGVGHGGDPSLHVAGRSGARGASRFMSRDCRQRSRTCRRAPNVRSEAPLAPSLSRSDVRSRGSAVPFLSRQGDGRAELSGSPSTSPDAPGLVLRLWPRPRPLEVRIEAGRPGAVALDGGWQAVRSFLGPERLSGDWWEDAYRREYYRVRTEAGDLLWVFYDPRCRGWFWHGWWD